MSAAPAADHVLRMLTPLSHHPSRSRGMVAATLRLPRSTTYRLLSILIDHGFVHYLPEERRYGERVAAYELARPTRARPATADRPSDRAATGRPHEAECTSACYTVEMCSMSSRSGQRAAMLITDVGVRLPAVLTASGLAMLARLPAAQVRLFPNAGAFVETEHGPTTPTALRQLLSDVRNRGYAAEEGSVTIGLSSLAQAVLDHAVTQLPPSRSPTSRTRWTTAPKQVWSRQ